LRRAETIEKGHGRIETRRLEVTASLAEHLSPSWAGLAQVCRLTRERIVRGKTATETVYGITSPTADEAGPERMLQLSRDHWGLTNPLILGDEVLAPIRRDSVETPAGYKLERHDGKFGSAADTIDGCPGVSGRGVWR
jgi:hypothetical protein